MSSSDCNLLESVIHLTRERDKRSLEYSFIEILTEVLQFDIAMLLNVSHGRDDWNLEILSYYAAGNNDSKPYTRPQIIVPMDEFIRRSIESQEVVVDTHDQTSRTIHPIIINKTVKSLLVLYTRNADETSEKIISSFVKIYANFVAVLDDSERDTLTGLFNRKAFDTHIKELLLDVEKTRNSKPQARERRTAKDNACRWLGILDIDHFKHINDNYGHLYGDEVLVIFSNIMEASFRKSDLLFRYGGEEFVVVLNPATEKQAEMVFNRFRNRLEEHDIPQVGRVTVSIGISRFSADVHPTSVVENADQALYYSKDHGRNQVSNYHQLITGGAIKSHDYADEIEMF
jgi:diguanylate cyclase (GGDEF)-like protein